MNESDHLMTSEKMAKLAERFGKGRPEVYNEFGHMSNAKAAKVATKLGRRAAKLMEELLMEGMTILEGHALKDFFKGQIDAAAYLVLAKQQCKLQTAARDHLKPR